MNNINYEIGIMQENLCDLRRIAGWTAENLADRLGITKQTISNLENQKIKMTTIQYIAIRSIFECEISSNPENTTLRSVMTLLFDTAYEYYESSKESIRTAMIAIASMSFAGLSGISLHASATALLAPFRTRIFNLSVPHRSEPTLLWLQKHLDNIQTEHKNLPSQSNENDERI